MQILLAQFYSSAPAPDFHEMANALRGWGHTVFVGSPNASGDLEWSDGRMTVALLNGPAHLSGWMQKIRGLDLIGWRVSQMRFMMRVRTFLRGRNADIVQVNPTTYVWLLPMLMPPKMYFVLDVRQIGEISGNRILGRLKDLRWLTSLRMNARWIYDHACFATEAAAERVLGERWERWATVHRVGQDPRFLNYRWEEFPKDEPSGPIRFVYIGTLSKFRSLENILAAIRWVLERTPEIKVDFVGPDAAGGFYHDLVNKMRLDGVVGLKPPVKYQDVPGVLASYDVALAYVPPLPDWKYQPTLKVLEYRALGMPIIASDNGPNREVVEDGVNGILIEDTIESLGSAMLRFIQNRDFLRRCRQNARSMRRGRTWSESARRYEELVYKPAMDR